MCGTTNTNKKDSANSCGCGCGYGSSGGFMRRFWSKDEKKDCMDVYRDQLKKELSALDECIQEGCC